MSPASPSLIKSLRNLSEKIDAAEKVLHKMPGGMRATADVTECFVGEERASSSPIRYSLETTRDDKGTHIGVCERSIDDDYEDRELKLLDEYPVSTRIDLAYYIPNLIKDARVAEQGMEVTADFVADRIEQAIAEA
jgi:hypothetical protein